jgi:hypothetical protein
LETASRRSTGRSDVETLTYPLYEELLAEVGCLSPETQRHYANMLLAMLNRAKAQRIIPRHHLEGVPVPQVVHDDEPEPWSHLELGILMGQALRAYEAEQAAWNARVAHEKKNRGLRSPSYPVPRQAPRADERRTPPGVRRSCFRRHAARALPRITRPPAPSQIASRSLAPNCETSRGFAAVSAQVSRSGIATLRVSLRVTTFYATH